MRVWLLLVASSALSGCADEALPAPPPAPVQRAPAASTVLEVEGLGVTRSEVDALAADVLLLYPEYSRAHARRLALTNEFLPRLAVRAQARAAWQAARTACAEAIPTALEPLEIEGDFGELGLALWSAARRLAPGEWSPPLELTARWVRVRLEQRSESAEPRLERLRLALLDFPLLAPDGQRIDVAGAPDRARLVILDREFDEAVPEAWKHRMRATKP